MIVAFGRRRFGNSLRPVNRIKHVVDIQNAIVAGTQANELVILTKDAPVLAQVKEVQTGCTINGIYAVIECYGTTSGALSNVYLIVWKNPGGNLVAPTANTVGLNDNKRFVIHQEMVMLQKVTNSNPRTLFKGVIAIPKIYRRFAPNDELKFSLLAPGVNIDYCIQVHYKEFR